MRLFVAVDVDPRVASRLGRVAREIVETGARVKPVEENNMHITLKFLGEVRDDLLNSIVKVVESLEKEAFNIVIRGVGAFPPRVIWAGVEEGSEELGEMVGFLEKKFAKLGFPRESKRFHPHVTLARVKAPQDFRKIEPLIRKYSDFLFGEFEVKHVRLKQSTLTPKGPIYKTVFEKALH